MSKPDDRLASCTETRTDSKIRVESHSQKAVFDNSDRAEIRIIDVDCWLAAETGPRADRIVSKPDVVDIVVELKGKNIRHALDQISATCQRWRAARSSHKRMGGLVVFSRSPDNSADIADSKARFLKTHNIRLQLNKNNQTEYRFEKFT